MIILNIVTKFLSFFEKKHKRLWEDFFNKNLPQHNISFKSEEDYLLKNNITKKQVIKNSIIYVYPTLDKYDLDCLISYFEMHTINNKIRVLEKSKAIYLEIVEALTYIKQIKDVLLKYPKQDGNHHGTRHRQSSFKNIVKTQLNDLESRLNNPFFHLTNEDEIKKTKLQINFIKKLKEDEFKDLPEWLNYVRINIGFENKLLKSSKIDIEAFYQLSNFFNGIKSSYEELLKSVTIILREKSNIKIDDKQKHKELADNILNITKYFFYNEIKEIESNKTKRTFTYKDINITKIYITKTFLYDIPIYSYLNNNENPLNKLFTIGFNSMIGIKSSVDKASPTIDEISNIQILRNLSLARKEFKLTKNEFRYISHLLESMPKSKLSRNKTCP